MKEQKRLLDNLASVMARKLGGEVKARRNTTAQRLEIDAVDRAFARDDVEWTAPIKRGE